MELLPIAIAAATFFVISIVSITQLEIQRRRHRFDVAPFLRFDIEQSTASIPSSDPPVDKHIVEIDELSEWANANPKAQHRYMIIRLENKQNHIAGVAIAVSFRFVLRFPKYETPHTNIELGRRLKGVIWLETEEIYRIALIDLKGLPSATIDIDKIEYYNVDGKKYNRSYGYYHWELDNAGEESTRFRAFPKLFPPHIKAEKMKISEGADEYDS